ncbi:MAG: hypothetical protein KKA32_17025 [Actinobacteria bacterium]|nr:hypothetical protein [Actinomycetota bacterium]
MRPTFGVRFLDHLASARGLVEWSRVSHGGPLGPDPRRAIELLVDEVLPRFR